MSRLREWLGVDRTKTRLAEAARDWKTSGRDVSYLYTGSRLATAEEWAESHPGKLSTEEAEFLRCSRDTQKKQEKKHLETASQEPEPHARNSTLNLLVSKANSHGKELSRLTLDFSPKVELQDEELESLTKAFIGCTNSEFDDAVPGVYKEGFLVTLVKIKADWRGLPIPNRMPLIVPRRPLIGEAGMQNVRRLLTGQEQEPSRVAIVLTLSNQVQAMALAEAAKKQIRSKYACDAVVLSAEDLLNISTTAEPERHLRRIVLNQIDLTSCSPFIINGPAATGMFFGRENELRDIEDHVENTSFAFIGGRRIGKSSILMRLHLFLLPFKTSTVYISIARPRLH